jgi:hypothetical protein
MTQDEFRKVLDEKRYSYEIEGDKVVVTNKGYITLDYITSLPPGVEFRNEGAVYLRSLKSIPPGVEFRNGGMVKLESLIGGWMMYWRSNIKGIDPNRLLNAMIKQGVFER